MSVFVGDAESRHLARWAKMCALAKSKKSSPADVLRPHIQPFLFRTPDAEIARQYRQQRATLHYEWTSAWSQTMQTMIVEIP